MFKKVRKIARNAIVSDEILDKTISPIINKSVELVDKSMQNNVKLPNVIGLDIEEAKSILESFHFIVSIVEVRKPNKKYATFNYGEVVEMEHDKPNIVLKGLPRGSLIKLFIVNEKIISESNSWKRKIFD